jgi:glycosyltransferase involved in cell wall biosynthesis
LSKKYTIPYFITTHNERFYFDHILSKKIALKILSNASVVLPINFTNYSYFKKSGLTNITLNPLGFNKSFLREQKTGQNKIVSILTVAELIKLKNIDKVILAIKNLVSKYNISYTIIGKGPERENLEKLVEQHHLDNFVRFMGSIPHDQIAGEMYRHDIFIMSSYFETFGRVYFEAMAMGIPVICAKNSGIDGIFKDMEEGIAVNHSDIHEITGALEFLISNPEERIRIGKNGKKLVEHYTWENIARDLQSKYLKVVKKNRLK